MATQNDDMLSLHGDCDTAQIDSEARGTQDILSALQEQTHLLAKALEANSRGRKRQRGSRRAETSSSSPSSTSPSCSPPPSEAKIRGKKLKSVVQTASRDDLSSGEELEEELCQVATSDNSPQPPANEDLFACAEAELLGGEELGPPVHQTLSSFVDNRFSKKLDEPVLKKKLSEHKRPSNCETLHAPITNPMIWKVLGAPYRRNDSRLTNVQTNVCKATTAIVEAVDKLHELKPQMPALQEPLRGLLDAVSLLGHTNQQVTAFRKDAQRYALPYDFKDVCDVEAGGSKFLYGDDVRKSLREAKDDQRLASSLNFGSGSATKSKTRPFLGQRKPSGQQQQRERNYQTGQAHPYRKKQLAHRGGSHQFRKRQQ